MTFPCSALYSEEFTAHELPRSRENKDRLLQAISHVPDHVKIHEPHPALVSDLERVHIPQHIRMIEQFSSYGGVHYIDMDTYVTGDSFRIALLAAGSGIDAAKRASAYKVIAVIPYYGFARQDRKDELARCSSG